MENYSRTIEGRDPEDWNQDSEVCHSAVSHLVFYDSDGSGTQKSDSGLQAQSPCEGRERQNHKNIK